MLAPVFARRFRPAHVVILAVLLYPVVFLTFYPCVGRGVCALTLAPVLMAGWFYGSRAGLLMALTGILLNIALLNLVEHPAGGWSRVLDASTMPRMLVCVALGLAVGWVRGVRDQLRLRLDQLTTTEAALRQSESRKTAVLEAAPDAVVAMDHLGRILEFNAAAQQLFGYRREEAVGRLLAELIIPPQFREQHQTALAWYTTTGSATILGKRLELTAQRADGSEFPVEVSIARAGEIEPPVFTGFVRDLTERKQAEQSLRESEERYRCVVDQAADAILMIDSDGRLVDVNRRACEGLGYSRAELLRMTLSDIAPNASNQELQPGDTVTAERFYQRKDGTVCPIEVRIGMVEMAGQRLRLVLARDITNRRRAEAALRKSESLLRLVWDNATDGMRLSDRDGNVLLVNDAYCQLVGRERAEIEGRPIAEVYAAGRRAELIRKYDDRFDGQTSPQYFETEVELLDGRRRYFEVGYARLELPSESPLRLSVLRDISERKQAEAELRDRESRYRYLFEHNPHPMWVFDTETLQFLAVNDAAIQCYGYSRDEFLQMTVVDIRPEEDRANFLDVLQQKATRIRDGLPARHRWKDGTLREVEIASHSLQYHDRPARLILAVDVTEQRQVEAALRDREELLRAIIAHIPCSVFWKDRESVYLGCNDQTVRDFGFTSPDQIIGRTDLDLAVDPAEAAFYRECDRRVIESGEPMLNLEEMQTRSDGARAVLLTSKVPLRNGEGGIIGVLGTYQDITERKKLEEQYRQSQKMEAVGRLAGGVAHDFNNLLTVINGFSQLLLSALSGDDANRPMVEEIQRAGDRAAALTRQLLAFGRKQMLQPRVLDLNALLANLGKMLPRLIGEDIELRTVLAADLHSTRVDPGQIEQVILNLMVNARDAMPTGGRLTIETANVELDEEYARDHADVRPGPYVMLAVTDTGCGMDRATLARVFEPFFTTKPVGQGTGLGLATVYGIVKQTNGSVFAYSEVGIGTTFKVYLPCAEGSRPGLEATPPPVALGGRETVLLVEDEESVRALTRRVLHAKGYDVLEAANGPDALALAARRTGPLHLLVTDVVMPRMSGRELAARLEEVRPGVKVLYVSGYTDDAVVRHGVLEAGALFLQKPFSPDALARKVREALTPAG